jgi:uncharacterized protein involved in exopolysaccharide biosynthesis
MNTAANPASAVSGAADDGAPIGLAIGDYLTVVTRRAGTILVPFVLVTVVATAVAFLLPQQFTEKVVVRVEDPEVVGAFFTQIGLSVPHKQILTGLQPEVGSPTFLAPIVKAMKLREGFNPDDPKEREELMKRVRDKLVINTTFQKTGPDFFSIAYTGEDAAKVARFVVSIRDEYQRRFLAQYQNAVQEAYVQVKRVHDRAKADFNQASEDLRKFQDANGALFASGTRDVAAGLVDALGKQEAALVDYEAQQAGQRQTLADCEGRLAVTSPLRESATESQVSDVYKDQQALVNQLKRDLAELAKTKTEQHPFYVAKKAQLDTEEARLAQLDKFEAVSKATEPNPEYDRLTAQKAAAEAEIARLTQMIERTQAAVTETKNTLESLPEKLKRADALHTELDNAKYRFERAARQYVTVETTRERITGKETNFFTPIDTPTPEAARDREPVSPNVPLFIGIGAFVGLVLGAALAFLREFATAGFTTPNQVRYGLAAPVLGELTPILTASERAAAGRRRAFVVLSAVVVLGALAWCHVAYFTTAYRDTLPRPVFDVMRRIYGKG